MAEELNNKWHEIFEELGIKDPEIIADVKFISLKVGQKLSDFGSLPPGVLFISKGKIREITKNKMQEPFTTKIYREGAFAGCEHLLRGEDNVCFLSSSNVEGYLLKAETFLELITNSKRLLKIFSTISVQEIFYSLRRNAEFEELEFKDVQKFLKGKNEYKTKSFYLYNKPKRTTPLKGKYILSSGNVEGVKIGDILTNPSNINVKGKLPARLIKLTFDLNDKDLIGSSNTELKNENKNQKLSSPIDHQIQVEALEDWYGVKLKNNNFPECKGKDKAEQILAVLRMITRFFGIPFKKDFLKRVILNQIENGSINLNQLAGLSDLMGLRSTFLNPEDNSQLKRIPTPTIFLKNERPIIIWEINKNSVIIGDPKDGKCSLKFEEFRRFLDGSFMFLNITRTRESPKTKFGLSWFWPSLKKYKGSLIQVVIASFCVQLLTLLNPLLIQQIIDAVITQGNYSSLNILGGLLIFLAFAQALLGSLRTYLFTDTTNRIDVSLGSSIIRHLLRLPLGYFSRRPVGEVSGRVGELEKIRSFLTGTALSVILDSLFSVIYIAVLLTYSIQLTIWALGVLPIFITLTIFISPILRDQLRKKAEANAKVNSHLVESLSGMETIKGQNMELTSQWKWEQIYNKQVKEGFRNVVTSTAASSASNFLQQLSGLIIIWAGAAMVLQGKLTLGQLIAFRIISNYVTSPLLRLASLWQNFQETSISLERLADVVDHPEEIEITGENLPPLPPIKGDILYKNVNFRFNSSGPYQLLNVNFKVDKGSFTGIVGTSGSGKSTVLKLLSKLYEPDSGSIKIDGHDISKVDLYSLRTQIGVVPQDSILFDGTIQSNISLTKPEATYEEIIKASKIACAHEFIEKLSSGYANPVGERGSGLSGGQRQRLAIARVILKKPKLLILDEATSALDIDTEKRLLKNILEYFDDITILFISHRLSNLINASKVILMSDGTVVEEGTHEELMKLNGRYRTLYNQQESEATWVN
tara:strand:- start:2265 stop:5216 length:2952 start_codon:yes stop_codon:yes gene_type:complete